MAYPDLECFFINKNGKSINYNEKRGIKKEKKVSNVFNYPYDNRNTFLKKLKNNPSSMWPVGNDWSFRNKKK